MKKYLLVIILQVFALSMWADNNNDDDYILFHVENQESGTGMEYQVPVIGGIKNGNLNLTYKGSDYASVSVKDKNGSTVYQNSLSSSSRSSINLNGYSQGDYTVKVEDSKGNTVVANFQVSK